MTVPTYATLIPTFANLSDTPFSSDMALQAKQLVKAMTSLTKKATLSSQVATNCSKDQKIQL